VSPVLDASVFIAAISPAERHHTRARRLFESHPDTEPYLVPDLFRVEVIAALSRRGERNELLDAVDAIVQGPRFHAAALDDELLRRAVDVARSARLRAYDAVYVALALKRDQPILTLDSDVVERATTCFERLRVFGAE
jgi:predicted nucleic acid-binding protein